MKKRLLFAALLALAASPLLAREVTVDTVSDLATARVADGDFVRLLGRATVGDSRGGPALLYDADSAATIDNGIVFDGPGSVGRFIRQYEGPINILWFGAIPDDAMADSAAIQAAIGAVPTAGGSVLIPTGEFNITTKLTIAADDISLVGENGSKLTSDGSATIMIDVSADSDSVRIEGIEINGADSGALTAVKVNDNCDFFQLVDCEIHAFDDPAGGAILVVNVAGEACHDLLIKGCHIHDATSSATPDNAVRGIRIAGTTTPIKRGLITQCKIGDLSPYGGAGEGSDGIVVQDWGSNDVDLTISDNFIYDCGRRGIKLQVGGVSIVNNRIEAGNNDVGGVEPIYAIAVQLTSSNVIIDSNSIYSPDGMSNGFVGLSSTGSNFTVSNNEFRADTSANSSDGIRIVGAGSNYNIQGNMFYGQAAGDIRNGVQATAAATDINISNNVFRNAGSSGNNVIGLPATPTVADRILIANNVATGIVSRFISGTGLSTNVSIIGNRTQGGSTTFPIWSVAIGSGKIRGNSFTNTWDAGSISGTPTVNFSIDAVATLNELIGSITPTFTAPATPGWITWVVTQDDTGSWDINWSSVTTEGDPPTISNGGLDGTAGETTVIRFYYDGSAYHF